MENNQNPEKKLSAGKSILAVASVVLAIVLVAGVVMNNQNRAAAEEPTTAVQTEETTQAAEETAAPAEETEAAEEPAATEPTVPADGNPDDITCKGTYTAADDVVIAARDVIAATAGDETLTVSQLQAFYWMEVMNFLNNYGAYAAYFGLDYQQPLDTQTCMFSETPMTWQQFFLGSAIDKWHSYRVMSLEGAANGFTLPEEQQLDLDGMMEEMEAVAAENGMESASELLHRSLGAAADAEDYLYFTNLYYNASGYYTDLYNAVTCTDEELETYFDANAETFAQSGITKDTRYVDVRHILVYPEGADGTNIFTETFSDEAWAAGEAAAQEILNTWTAGDKNEESFAALANEHSQDPGSNQNGGLYEGVKAGEMVEAFNDWCFDANRQIGDTGIVRTEYGYHVMYFSGFTTPWQDAAKSKIASETANEQVKAAMEKYPLVVNYSDLLLANVDLA